MHSEAWRAKGCSKIVNTPRKSTTSKEIAAYISNQGLVNVRRDLHSKRLQCQQSRPARAWFSLWCFQTNTGFWIQIQKLATSPECSINVWNKWIDSTTWNNLTGYCLSALRDKKKIKKTQTLAWTLTAVEKWLNETLLRLRISHWSEKGCSSYEYPHLHIGPAQS